MYYIVGLGNPGNEYTHSRHNVGRMIVEAFGKEIGADFSVDKKIQSNKALGETPEGEKVTLILPNTYMNVSGAAVLPLITSVKKAAQLIVVQDDLDMPLGKLKVLFNRGPGGHKGIESIIKKIKTEQFIRLKVGVIPTTQTGKLKKPSGEALVKFIVGNFKNDELVFMKKIIKKAVKALNLIVEQGRERATGEINSWE